MSKQDIIKQDGIIEEALSNAMFRYVQMIIKFWQPFPENAYALYSNLPGDKVSVEMSPYDLSRGRIIYRYK
jgi:translation initiation factor IF-1